MYSHKIKDEKIATMSKTKLFHVQQNSFKRVWTDGRTYTIMVTRKGSWMPAVLKKYYSRVSFNNTEPRSDYKELTVEYPKTMGAPAVH